MKMKKCVDLVKTALMLTDLLI